MKIENRVLMKILYAHASSEAFNFLMSSYGLRLTFGILLSRVATLYIPKRSVKVTVLKDDHR